MTEVDREWSWETEKHHCFVKLLSDGRLEWGGWENVPRGGGGAVYQEGRDYLKTGKPGYTWLEVPPDIQDALVTALKEPKSSRNLQVIDSSPSGRTTATKSDG